MIDGQYMLFEDDTDLRLNPDDLDKVFLCGSGYTEGKKRIYEQIIQRKGVKEDAAFLKKEYGIGGRSFDLAGRPPMFMNYDSKGIVVECWKEGKKRHFTWEEAARQIGRLVFSGKYYEGEQ